MKKNNSIKLLFDRTKNSRCFHYLAEAAGCFITILTIVSEVAVLFLSIVLACYFNSFYWLLLMLADIPIGAFLLWFIDKTIDWGI